MGKGSYNYSKKQKYSYAPKRQVDKKVVAGSIIVVNPSQTNIQLTNTSATQGSALTVKGLRWTLDIGSAAATNTGCYWAIVLVPSGSTPSALGSGGNTISSLYPKEEYVLTSGTKLIIGGSVYTTLFEGDIKTGRILKTGDQLYFCVKCDAAGSAALTYDIQWFEKH